MKRMATKDELLELQVIETVLDASRVANDSEKLEVKLYYKYFIEAQFNWLGKRIHPSHKKDYTLMITRKVA